MAKDNIDPGRRTAITAGTAIVGSIGAAVATWPFLSSMNPSASVLAAGVPVEVDVSKMELGQQIQEVWRRKPVWIIRRTPEMVNTLAGLTKKLRDPNSETESQQPAFAQNEFRSINEEFLVLIGICTHLGCSPEFKPTPGEVGATWQGGFYCACHGSRFDLAGRVFKNVPANKNLEVPPYHFITENRILIGLTEEEGLSMSEQSTGLLGWINARFPLSKMMREHLSEYYAPKNFNFWYFFGSLALLVLVIQILSGIFLTMHYKPDAALAFASVEHIMRDVNWGWLIRYMHSTGASFFFIVVYLHMFRGLMYGSFKNPRELIWLFGMLIYVALMAEAFMGYLLPWGNMSYWGAQVIINLFNTIPFIGEAVSEWIRGDFVISDATLNRFFALHVIAVPLALLGLIIGHILALHEVGSNNPDGVEIKKTKGADGIPLDGIPFHPYYTVKDILGSVVFLAIFAFVLFFMPEMNGYFLEPANFDPANALNTPDHIAPIWYFTPFYTVLRAIPDPFLGFMMMAMAIVVLFLLPWIDRNPIKSIRYRSTLFKINLIIFVITFLILGYLGLKSVTDFYSQLALRFTEIYFLFFFMLWAYSKPRSSGFWIGSFIVLLAGLTAYDFLANSSEQPSLIWKTWVIPAAYLFITLLLPLFTNWDSEKQVPERVTS